MGHTHGPWLRGELRIKDALAQLKLAEVIKSQLFTDPAVNEERLMSVTPGSFTDFIYQHPWLVSSSVIGHITVTRKVILKGLPALRQIIRSFWVFLGGVETDWREYQEARPRRNGEGRRVTSDGAKARMIQSGKP